jgi:hypothetical protein
MVVPLTIGIPYIFFNELRQNVFYKKSTCEVHRAHGIVAKAVDEVKLVGDAFALHEIHSNVAVKERLLRAWKVICYTQLDRIPVPKTWKPDEATMARLDSIADHTIGRNTVFCRGRVDDGESLFKAMSEETHNTRKNKLRFFNGDIRSRRMIHYCLGAPECCGNEDECAEMCYAAGVESGMVLHPFSARPSHSRFGTFGDSTAEQNLGFMIHDITSQIIEYAYPSWDAMLPPPDPMGNEDEDEHRKKIQRKVYRSREICRDRPKKVRASEVTWASEAMDHMWLRVELLDHQGSLSRDSQFEATSPYEECLRSMASELQSLPKDSDFFHAVWRWALTYEEECEMLANYRNLFLSLYVQVWFFYCVPAADFPDRFTKAFDARSSEKDKVDILKEFYDLPECDLDEFFGKRVTRSNCGEGAVKAHTSHRIRTRMRIPIIPPRGPSLIMIFLVAYLTSCSGEEDISRSGRDAW